MPPESLLTLLIERAIREPRAEQTLAENMPQIGKRFGPDAGSSIGEDAVSEAVRGQYEQNPYPRWIGAAPGGSELGEDLIDSLVARFPEIDEAAFRSRTLRILAAGCGTGQDPVRLALANPGAEVEAVDLSRNSLAYGQRMAERFGVSHIQFRQADLRGLDEGERFDLISSTGVLHHMADPEEGLVALLANLRPGGLLRLGLYSQLARAEIDRARAFLAEEGILGDTQSAIRDFRARVIAGEWPELNFLTSSDDFYVTSGCRDLVFHVHEMSYTLERLADLLVKHSCKFLGFDIDDPRVMASFGKEFPGREADLMAWHRFEVSNPATFRGMYQFWLRKSE